MKNRRPGPEPMAQFFNLRAQRYDQVHLGHVDGGQATKDLVAGLLPEGTCAILDLGCGTGLELEAVYARFPETRVTAVDIAEDMLQKLRERFPAQEMEIVRESYLDMDFGAARYDAVITVMSLHHLSPKQKAALFARIHDCLRPGGVFLNCDYFAPARAYELYRRLLLWALRKPPGSVHFDIPFTARHELALLRRAGFRCKAAWRKRKTWVLAAEAERIPAIFR